MANVCVLTGATEKLVEVIVDGKNYYVSEEVADSCSLKALSEKIRAKLTEVDSKKAQIEAQFDVMAAQMKMTREEIIIMFGGGTIAPAATAAQAPAPVPAAPAQLIPARTAPPLSEESGFRTVKGDLAVAPATSRFRVNADSKLGSSMPAYSGPMSDGKRVIETNKQIKVDKANDTVITKSDFGTTIVKITQTDGNKLSKQLCQVDDHHNLVRGSVVGSDVNRECPMCQGTGLARVNHLECPKCHGVGFIV